MASPALSNMSKAVLDSIKSIKKAGDAFATYAKKVNESLKKVVIGITGTATALTALGLRSTYEGELFSKAFEAMARSVANIFAPVVRVATTLLMSLTDVFKRLTPEAKNSILLFTGIAAAVGAFLAVLPGIITIGSGVVAAISAFISPIGLAITAIGAIIAAVVAWEVKTKGWQETISDAVAVVLDTWDLLVEAWNGVYTEVAAVLSAFGEIFTVIFGDVSTSVIDFKEIWDVVKSVVSASIAFFVSNFTNMVELIKVEVVNTIKMLKWMAENWKTILTVGMVGDLTDFPKLIEANLKNPVEEAAKAMQNSFSKSMDNKVKANKLVESAKGIVKEVTDQFKKAETGKPLTIKGKVGFESLEATFERLQSAMMEDPSMLVTKDTNTTIHTISEQMGTLINTVKGGQPAVMVGR